MIGSQPVLELLRQLIGRKGCYDPKRLIFLSLTGINIVAAATSPGVQGKAFGNSLYWHFVRRKGVPDVFKFVSCCLKSFGLVCCQEYRPLTVWIIQCSYYGELSQYFEQSFWTICTARYLIGSGHGYYSHTMSGRLSRLFTQFTVFQPSSAVLQTIYSKPMQSWLEQFPSQAVEHPVELAEVTGTITYLKFVVLCFEEKWKEPI